MKKYVFGGVLIAALSMAYISYAKKTVRQASYEILYSSSKTLLELKVNSAINRGAQVAGGVTINDGNFYQAVVYP